MAEKRAHSRHHLNPDARLGLRTSLAGLAVALVAVPFSLLLVAVLDAWGPLHRLDFSAARALNNVAVRTPALVTVLQAVSTWLGPTTFRVLAVVVALWLLWRRLTRLAIWLLVTVLGSGVLDTLVKNAVRRHRPVLPHPVAASPGFAFPSGHALGATVGVGALLLVLLPVLRRHRTVWIGAGVVLVLLVGFARIGLGVHYVSDVLGGYVLGLAWVAGTAAAFDAWRSGWPRHHPDLLDGLEPEAANQMGAHS